MNKLLSGFLCCCLIGTTCRIWADTAQKRYDTKSAVIEYVITGDMEGTETAFIDNFGEKEARFTKYTLKMTGNDKEQDRVMIREGDRLTNVDLQKKKVGQF